MASCAKLTTSLEGHINRVRQIESKLDMLENMRARGKVSETLYKGIIDEVARKIGIFNGGMDVLMCLTDECLALLRRTDAVPSLPVAPEERHDGLRICVDCGQLNPKKVNYCISCASRLPGLVDLSENKGLLQSSRRVPGILPENWLPKKREGRRKGYTKGVNAPNFPKI